MYGEHDCDLECEIYRPKVICLEDTPKFVQRKVAGHDRPETHRRLEETADGVRVVTKDLTDLYDYRTANVLKRECRVPFTDIIPTDGDPKRTQIGSAARIGDSSCREIHGTNGIYAEVSFDERKLTDSERVYCDEHTRYCDVESVVEFEIPHSEDLQSAIADQDLGRFDCLPAVIEDHDRRHEVLIDLQEQTESERLRKNQLHPWEGIITDVDPEWNPETTTTTVAIASRCTIWPGCGRRPI